MNLHVLAYVLPLLFLLYQLIIDFIDLFPFNDVRSRDKRLRKYEVLGNYPPLIIIALCFYFNNQFAYWVGLLLTSIIMIMHLFTWWFPYFFGYPNNIRTDYEKYFKRTFKFLPKIKDHIIPDAEHVGVGILLTITLLVQIIFVNH